MRKAFWFSALFLPLFSCEKPKGNLSEDILPEGDLLRFSASSGAPFEWTTEKADSLISQNLSASLLGTYKDPETGLSQYATSFQLRLSSHAVQFGDRDSIVVDSVLLSLAISSVYGKEDYGHQLELLELDEAINADSTYYSNKRFAVKGQNLLLDPNSPVVFNTEDIVVEGDTQSAQLRLPLAVSLGEQLIKNSTDDNYLNNENFSSFFKGFKISSLSNPGDGDGSAALLNMLSIYSNMHVYYHLKAKPDSAISFEYFINGNSQRVNEFQHDFTGSVAEQELNGTGNSPYAFVKSAAGLVSRFNIENLDTLKSIAPVGIASAEIFFPVKLDAIASDFEPGERLILVEVNEDGSYKVLPDQLEGDSYYGGTYDEEKGGYTFRIARFVQQYTRRTEEFYGFALIPSFGGVRANRTLLLKAQENGVRPELIVYFTQL